MIIIFEHFPAGWATTQEQWVFDLVDISHKPALGYMEMVSRRDANTLLPIIQAHVLPGTMMSGLLTKSAKCFQLLHS